MVVGGWLHRNARSFAIRNPLPASCSLLLVEGYASSSAMPLHCTGWGSLLRARRAGDLGANARIDPTPSDIGVQCTVWSPFITIKLCSRHTRASQTALYPVYPSLSCQDGPNVQSYDTDFLPACYLNVLFLCLLNPSPLETKFQNFELFRVFKVFWDSLVFLWPIQIKQFPKKCYRFSTFILHLLNSCQDSFQVLDVSEIRSVGKCFSEILRPEMILSDVFYERKNIIFD